MYSQRATTNTPQIIIDFPQLLFEISGNSTASDPAAFYQPVLDYIYSNFYEVNNSIHQRSSPQLTLHFYMGAIAPADLEMIRKIDDLFHRIKEFTTYNYWYFHPDRKESIEQGELVKEKFLNQTRLIADSVHVM